MVGHFGMAVKEISEALLPGGSLNPPNKAINTMITAVGGLVGPVAVFFALLNAFFNAVGEPASQRASQSISLAWSRKLLRRTNQPSSSPSLPSLPIPYTPPSSIPDPIGHV